MTFAWRTIATVLFVTLVAAIVRLAWLGDDAFITFRSVENLVHGYGPVWNVDERVQTYTHPLWFWLLCGLRALTGECELSAQVFGIVLSTATAALLVVWCRRASTAAVVLCLLLGSRAWTSYATSGLETSLTCLLVTLLFFAWRSEQPAQRLRRVALVVGLLATTRFDLALLGLPPLVLCLRGVPWRRAMGTVLLGLSPVLLWTAFALAYYGSPFPITAYAKAFCHGVPAPDLVLQGLRYLWRNAIDDPVTVAVIAAGIGGGLCRGPHRGFALGALLYTAYVVKVGGDYMLGRFLLPVFSVGIVLVAAALAERGARTRRIVMAFAIGLSFVPGVPEAATPLRTGNPSYRPGADGIVDEQIQGHWDHGLLSRGAERAAPGYIGAALQANGITRRVYTLGGWIGWLGYTSGPQVHVIDPWLTDPLLMRLPVADPQRWRVGHFLRRIPAGYLESLASGENRIPHAGLARCYDAVRSITRDPVWSGPRWHHLLALWTGRLDAGLADYVATQYRTPPRDELPLAAIAAPLAPGSFWFDVPAGRTAAASGLTVRLDAVRTAAAVVLHVSGETKFRLRFLRDGAVVGDLTQPSPVVPPDLLAPLRFEVPAAVGPFDTLCIDADVDLWHPAAAFVGRVEIVD